MFRVEHAHHQRGKRHQQHEGPHDAREQNCQRGLVRRPASPCQKIDKLRREHDSEQGHRAHENGRERRNFVCESPRRFIAIDRDFLRKRRDERCR